MKWSKTELSSVRHKYLIILFDDLLMMPGEAKVGEDNLAYVFKTGRAVLQYVPVFIINEM